MKQNCKTHEYRFEVICFHYFLKEVKYFANKYSSKQNVTFYGMQTELMINAKLLKTL